MCVYKIYMFDRYVFFLHRIKCYTLEGTHKDDDRKQRESEQKYPFSSYCFYSTRNQIYFVWFLIAFIVRLLYLLYLLYKIQNTVRILPEPNRTEPDK